MHAAAPRLTSILDGTDEEDKEKLMLFVRSLFRFAPKIFAESLQGFRNVLVAILLMYFEEMVTDCTADHVLV